MSSEAVVVLARQHAGTFERRQFAAGLVARVSRVQAYVSGRWARFTLTAVLKTNASFMTDQAVWHRGAAASVDRADRSESLDPDFAMIDRVLAMEGRLQKLRAQMLAGQQALGRDPGSASAAVLRDAMTVWSAAASDLYEALREFRGALQAYEADVSAQARAGLAGGGAVTEAELSAQLDAALRR